MLQAGGEVLFLPGQGGFAIGERDFQFVERSLLCGHRSGLNSQRFQARVVECLDAWPAHDKLRETDGESIAVNHVGGCHGTAIDAHDATPIRKEIASSIWVRMQ